MRNDDTHASTDGGTTVDRHDRVVGDLDENVAGLLCYSLLFVTGVAFLVLEQDNDFVRFHAAQSTIVFGALVAASFGVDIVASVMGIVPIVGWAIAIVAVFASIGIGLATIVLWVFLMVKAYSGERYVVPVAGPVAEDLV